MKGFLITLLAFPAVLAVPAPTTTSDDWPTQFPIDTFKCRCSDGVSKTTIGSCLYFGQGIGPEGDDWCFPVVSYNPHMDEVFTADYCKQNNSRMPIPQCTPIKLCKSTQATGVNYEYFKIC